MQKLQRAIGNQALGRLLAATARPQPIQEGKNRGGLHDKFKAGIENLSGVFTDDVEVHCGSAAHARLQALAYTRGTHIHAGPGQEEHLPHEAWHVAQQKLGRVRPSTQLKELPVNDDAALEKEADAMAAKALRMTRRGGDGAAGATTSSD